MFRVEGQSLNDQEDEEQIFILSKMKPAKKCLLIPNVQYYNNKNIW